MNNPIMIVCEGSSEENYIIQLNRLFRYPDSDCRVFIPCNAHSGRYSLIRKKFEEVQKRNKRQKDKIKIWLDKDLYIREGTEENSRYNSKDYLILQCLFSLMNFEDYLAMHCLPEIVGEWQSICESNNHFVAPMHASQYEKPFNEFISKNFSTDYRKGEVPFDLTQQRILQLFDNLKSNKFKFENDFGRFLMKLYETNSVEFK